MPNIVMTCNSVAKKISTAKFFVKRKIGRETMQVIVKVIALKENRSQCMMRGHLALISPN